MVTSALLPHFLNLLRPSISRMTGPSTSPTLSHPPQILLKLVSKDSRVIFSEYTQIHIARKRRRKELKRDSRCLNSPTLTHLPNVNKHPQIGTRNGLKMEKKHPCSPLTHPSIITSKESQTPCNHNLRRTLPLQQATRLPSYQVSPPATCLHTFNNRDTKYRHIIHSGAT